MTWLRRRLAAPTLGNWRLDWGVGLLAGALGACAALWLAWHVLPAVVTTLVGWLP